ncbi:hypothetical protein ACFOLJ_03860 [Rugamonas sp. CCM 8940]|uniref:hypothetical protein n=1 Tax=Rugamonas sp. CCM 8940 TaxID=2765359 RepID=UPI0018F4876C|nr:hypothetical protein [Rugamonas sp. CCM 8940]MBJ7313399.1 hypothetical protein [Rugamonas sp. CCM 8940]
MVILLLDVFRECLRSIFMAALAVPGPALQTTLGRSAGVGPGGSDPGLRRWVFFARAWRRRQQNGCCGMGLACKSVELASVWTPLCIIVYMYGKYHFSSAFIQKAYKYRLL